MNRLLIIALALLLTACHSHDPHETEHGHGHDAETAADEPEKGPHRGRMLREGDFALEVAIFESGVPPEFHLYATQAGQPVPPEQVKAQIELIRLGDPTDQFTFTPDGDHLKGSGVVKEPHSFEVKVRAEHAGKTYTWAYESFEGRTRISEKVAQDAGIRAEPAGPGVIRETVSLYGRIEPDADRVRRVVPRFPGPIRSVDVEVGDVVKAGQTLATVESNESLRNYTVTAPMGGVITERHGGPGDIAGDTPLFVIADVSRVWADLAVFPRDRARVRAGQPVSLRDARAGTTGQGTVDYLAPLGRPADQSQLVRVVLDNADGRWVPGSFVEAVVTVGERAKDLVVRNAALQTFRDFTVVFARVGEQYEVRMLELGQADDEHVEVLGGLTPGTEYVTQNSYLIKADVEKSGAAHDH
ncbi:efflux RND transporter periplasmic adaptor subunit [Sinimarinibacterium flocculans]|uniref:efflux RND transporter periplasmic adaptor subunit n=1 Tax=Sinimarinibacterium flocculans TaxID=985250 RepID=UPI003518A51D